MVDLTYLRRKRVRKTVALIGCISAACAIVIGAVAALGQYASPLTVKLNNSNCSLGLLKSATSTESKTFLVADNAPAYTENSYNYIFADQSEEGIAKIDADIDNELSKSKITGDGLSTLYYKYTFYVENLGDSNADYEIQLNIDRTNSNSEQFDLADILRVRFYENADQSQHESKTYAKSDIEQSSTGEIVRKPVHISTSDTPLCEDFVSSKTIIKVDRTIKPKEKYRYTFLLWLEGFDRDSDGKKAPTNSSLALGVDISAHESAQPAQ